MTDGFAALAAARRREAMMAETAAALDRHGRPPKPEREGVSRAARGTWPPAPPAGLLDEETGELLPAGRDLLPRERSVIRTPQERLDRMTDDEKWAWASSVIEAERALSNQTTLEGHHR